MNSITINNFNQAGLSDSLLSGLPNSLYKIVGLDLHSKPGIISSAPSLVKESGSTVTEFCRQSVVCPDGTVIFFSHTSGKIWMRDTGGTYTLAYTTTPAAGSDKCLGACYHQDYVYWATQSRLHRIPISGLANWATNAVPNWATFENTDTLFHPMISHSGLQVLYIGDGKCVAQVDNNVFSANAIDIRSPLRIRCLGEWSTDLLMGTWVAEASYNANIFRWNGVGESFTNSCFIEETGVNCFFKIGNATLAQIGMAGNIYQYNGDTAELWKKIPGTYNSTSRWYMWENSVASINGKILLAPSYVYGSSLDQGIYQIANYDNKYSKILDMPYVISERSGGDFVLSGIEIGAIAVSGYDIFVCWKNGSNYGVDKINYSIPLDKSYIETRAVIADRNVETMLRKVGVAYSSMPSGCSLEVSLNKNYSGYVSQTNFIKDTERLVYELNTAGLTYNTLQLKLVFRTSGANSPEVESIIMGVE